MSGTAASTLIAKAPDRVGGPWHDEGVKSAVASPTMIGRDHDLQRLQDALAEAATGVPRALVVAGEAGIGKTRLLTEFEAASAGSARILSGQCVDLGSAGTPYAPIIAVLRSLVQQAGEEAVLAASGPGRDALTLLLPELAGAPIDPTAAGVDRLHEVVAVVLETFAREQTVVVMIEDLHWVDSASLTVLRFLLNAVTVGRIMLLLSYRSEDVGRAHPLRSFLTDAERARLLTRIELRRLTVDEVAAQAQQILGFAPEPATLASVFERSEGVPFFVEELVDQDRVTLPETLRDLLLARYDRLAETAQQLLRILSAGGTTVSHRLLSAVYEQSLPDSTEANLDAAAREAISANVLTAGPGSYTFRHALVREAIHADLLPGERARFHTAFAEGLEATPGSSSAEVAQHWFAAGNPAEAFPAALTAMGDARRSYAYASAAQFGERALTLWEQVAGAQELAGMTRVDLLAKTASALRNAGDGERSLAMVNDAIAECEDRTSVTYARLLRDKAYYLGNVVQPGSIPLLEEALGLVPPGVDEHLRVTLLNTLAGRLMLEVSLDRAVEVSEEALALALSIQSPAQASIAANLAGLSKAQRGQLEEGIAQLDHARALAEGDPGALLRYRVNASDLRFHLGQFEHALALAEKGMIRARELGVERVSGVILASNAVEPLIALGRWDQAQGLIDRMLALSPSAAFKMYLQRAKVWLLLWRGDVAAAVSQYRSARPLMRDAGLTEVQNLLGASRVFAEVFLEKGDLDEAWVHASVLLTDSHRAIPGHELPLLAVAARVLAHRRSAGSASLAELETAEMRLRQLLEEMRFWPTWQVWAAQFEAELADPATGVAAWRHALEVASPGPAHLTPYSLFRLGQAELAAGDRAGARDSLRAAVTAARELGSGLIVDRVASFADRAGLVLEEEHPVRASDSLALTPRERQVLELIAQGLSNRQIGEQLFISAKTASVHVSAILRKLGAATRTEAAFLAPRELVD